LRFPHRRESPEMRRIAPVENQSFLAASIDHLLNPAG